VWLVLEAVPWHSITAPVLLPGWAGFEEPLVRKALTGMSIGAGSQQLNMTACLECCSQYDNKEILHV